MHVTNTYQSAGAEERAARLAAIRRRCVLLILALRSGASAG